MLTPLEQKLYDAISEGNEVEVEAVLMDISNKEFQGKLSKEEFSIDAINPDDRSYTFLHKATQVGINNIVGILK